MNASDTAIDSVLRISIGRHVSAAASDYVREKIVPVLDNGFGPVLGARIRLTGHPDPAVARPIVAQANVDTNGRGVRVQVAAATTREAVDLLAARLKTRMERLSRHRAALRDGRRGLRGHEWRHGDGSRIWLTSVPRESDQREVVRRKSYALIDETCDEAIFDMELMDYEFHLFTESGSGVDSVMYRTADAEYLLAQVNPHPESVIRGAITYTISGSAAPTLDIGAAVDRLELTGWPFVFFCDRDSNRGSVLYHRYDGDYGLITPPTR
ncbi:MULTISPECIES: sigma 54 modulation/S30EA ribosomal C-terminal domain-containing protein [Nocardia]|uniref:sigma 54 modulation/S30EA ribosomal C-terminal domain-containing protein n=1 Tax=Nocardia TaxID=1817 RepID=UPI000D6859A7|nr:MULTISPECIES: sigma 54 modulation/S30EA ribosomal C-terminal domain-containing protein [Nocardia]